MLLLQWTFDNKTNINIHNLCVTCASVVFASLFPFKNVCAFCIYHRPSFCSSKFEWLMDLGLFCCDTSAQRWSINFINLSYSNICTSRESESEKEYFASSLLQPRQKLSACWWDWVVVFLCQFRLTNPFTGLFWVRLVLPWICQMSERKCGLRNFQENILLRGAGHTLRLFCTPPFLHLPIRD